MTTLTETRPESIEAPQVRIAHIYEPWTSRPEGYPPVGAVALCGAVRRRYSTRVTYRDEPDACVVCCALKGPR